jgi:hypothetical protein
MGLDEAGVEQGGFLSVAGLVCREVNMLDCLSHGPKNANAMRRIKIGKRRHQGSKQ